MDLLAQRVVSCRALVVASEKRNRLKKSSSPQEPSAGSLAAGLPLNKLAFYRLQKSLVSKTNSAVCQGAVEGLQANVSATLHLGVAPMPPRTSASVCSGACRSGCAVDVRGA